MIKWVRGKEDERCLVGSGGEERCVLGSGVCVLWVMV